MSLATFKKKSINSASRATKISGKPTNLYWNYQGPFGNKDTLASYIFRASLVGDNDEVQGPAYHASNAGFSINGNHRVKGGVGKSMAFSQSATPYRGKYPKGWGGTNGRYPHGQPDVSLNITPVQVGIHKSATIQPSVLSNKGMLERRFRWINSGQYPNYWVQPIYTGNQTDTSSQGLYIHDKASANDCHYDVNNVQTYVGHRVLGGPNGCQTTPARGYKMVVQQSIAPYTKTIYQPKDCSAYILHMQRKCQNPIGHQKPFPYRVQTGTGVLRGGINVSNVASSCHTSNVVLRV